MADRSLGQLPIFEGQLSRLHFALLDAPLAVLATRCGLIRLRVVIAAVQQTQSFRRGLHDEAVVDRELRGGRRPGPLLAKLFPLL
ncbi:MAG: hypothetical protein VB875_01415 [Pirellulales bacterium]